MVWDWIWRNMSNAMNDREEQLNAGVLKLKIELI